MDASRSRRINETTERSSTRRELTRIRNDIARQFDNATELDERREYQRNYYRTERLTMKHHIALCYNRNHLQFDESFEQRHNLGKNDKACVYCGAFNFSFEGTKNKDGILEFSSCCCKGKVLLAHLNPTPQQIKDLFLPNEAGTNLHTIRIFKENIRKFNNALAFASINVKQLRMPGPDVYKIHGQIYNKASSLLPQSDSNPRYAQLYIVDTETNV